MSFRVALRPEAEMDIAEASAWYERQQSELGGEFLQAVSQAIDALADNPLVVSRRHRQRDIRWIYPDRFPYRVIYEIDDDTILIICPDQKSAAMLRVRLEEMIG